MPRTVELADLPADLRADYGPALVRLDGYLEGAKRRGTTLCVCRDGVYATMGGPRGCPTWRVRLLDVATGRTRHMWTPIARPGEFAGRWLWTDGWDDRRRRAK